MPDLRRLVQRPGRVGQVRPRHRAEVGTAGGDDHIHVVGLEDGAHGHGGDADLVAALKKRGFTLGGGYGRFKESTFRIGHMGEVQTTDLAALLTAMQEEIAS